MKKVRRKAKRKIKEKLASAFWLIFDAIVGALARRMKKDIENR